MKTINARSTKKDTKDAVSEVSAALKSANNIKAVIFFACSEYDNSVSALMQAEFPDITVFGCTSTSEILNGEYATHSLVATALTDELIDDVKVVALTNVEIGKLDIDDEIAELEEYYGTAFRNLDKEKYVGVVICCYNLKKIDEVGIYDEIGDRTSCLFAGATASSVGFDFDKIRVFANGQEYKDAAICALIKCKAPFAFEKMQAVERLNIPVPITKMGSTPGNVIEIDGINAADYFGKIYGLPREEIIKMDINIVMEYSMGIMINDEPYMHATETFLPDGSLQLNPPTWPSGKTELFIAKDLISTTKEQMAKIIEKHKSISFMITFDCAYRYMDAEANNKLDEYGGIWKDIPMMGLCTYGEYFICKVSQTTGILLFE
ncbi:MAG: hypothetical protein LBO69_09020 [Ignavibacteria bacterium]|jgi:hypothetical protein|nr:hypothetical protein [Ignavibacteria bacterium]